MVSVALNNEVLRVDEDGTRLIWSRAIMQGWGKRENLDKTHRPAAVFDTIPTCQIESGSPWQETKTLAAALPWPNRSTVFLIIAVATMAADERLDGAVWWRVFLGRGGGAWKRVGLGKLPLAYQVLLNPLAHNYDAKPLRDNIPLPAAAMVLPHHPPLPFSSHVSRHKPIWVELPPPTKVNRARLFGEIAPGFSRIVPDDAASRRVFSGTSRSPHPFIPAMFHTHSAPPSSTLKPRVMGVGHKINVIFVAHTHRYPGTSIIWAAGPVFQCLAVEHYWNEKSLLTLGFETEPRPLPPPPSQTGDDPTNHTTGSRPHHGMSQDTSTAFARKPCVTEQRLHEARGPRVGNTSTEGTQFQHGPAVSCELNSRQNCQQVLWVLGSSFVVEGSWLCSRQMSAQFNLSTFQTALYSQVVGLFQGVTCMAGTELPIYAVIILFASHTGEPGSTPGGVAPTFSQVGIVPDNATGRRVFSGISHLPRLCIPEMLPSSPHFALVGSKDLYVKRHPNIFTTLAHVTHVVYCFT
ncbi:hypothetical protein PR048_007287, partial [Dryococelus australis]